MPPTELIVHLDRIRENVRKTLAVTGPLGIDVVGVTKGVCGHPAIARALLQGGVRALADARLANLARLRQAGIEGPFFLLRSPALSETADCVELADGSLNADMTVLRALSDAAARHGKPHDVLLMVDLGTGREGFAAREVPDVCRKTAAMENLRLLGLGVYFAHEVPPDSYLAGQRQLTKLARDVESSGVLTAPLVSGGSTNVFGVLTVTGRHIEGINQLRLGTAMLLGIYSSVGPRPIAGFRQDTFLFRAELIEVKQRKRHLGILPFGHLDAVPECLYPVTPGIRVLHASCDHTIVDLTDAPEALRVGDAVEFHIGYFAMNRLVMSPYVPLRTEDEDAFSD